MELKTYLKDLLGDQESQKLIDAIAARKTIVISGPQGPTGKSTLCAVLRKAGASAVERMDVYEVTVHDHLEKLTPSMENLISV